jgi:pimeloyl-ACP methyl ester carboxylesterase
MERRYVESNNEFPGSMLKGTYYTFSGPGDASEFVVCVHGIGSFQSCFDRLALALSSKGFRVLQYDLIGRGLSSPSENGRYGSKEHIFQLAQLILDLSLPRFHLVGHSMGGALAVLFALQHSDKIKSLTLVAPAGLMNVFPLSMIKSSRCLQGPLRSMLSSRRNQEKAWRNDFYSHKGAALELEEQTVQSMHWMYDHNPEAFNAFFRSVIEFPLYGLDEEVRRLGRCDIPVLLVWGQADKAVPYKPCCQRWQNLLSEGGSKVTIKSYKRAGHGLLTEIHEVVNKDIEQFVSLACLT